MLGVEGVVSRCRVEGRSFCVEWTGVQAESSTRAEKLPVSNFVIQGISEWSDDVRGGWSRGSFSRIHPKCLSSVVGWTSRSEMYRHHQGKPSRRCLLKSDALYAQLRFSALWKFSVRNFKYPRWLLILGGICIPSRLQLGKIHSCEKLKHHFFEVSFQNERKGCFDAALALVAARRLYLVILRFVEFLWLSFRGGTPISDIFQKSKEKNREKAVAFF